jgi:hypothetical protein
VANSATFSQSDAAKTLRREKTHEKEAFRRLYTPPLDPIVIVKSTEEGSKGGVYIGDDMPRL